MTSTRQRLSISTLEPTRYEIVLYVGGVTTRRLGFSARRTREVLFDHAQNIAAEILGVLTEAEGEMEWTYDRAAGLGFGGGRVFVAFSGKTERDCAE